MSLSDFKASFVADKHLFFKNNISWDVQHKTHAIYYKRESVCQWDTRVPVCNYSFEILKSQVEQSSMKQREMFQ